MRRLPLPPMPGPMVSIGDDVPPPPRTVLAAGGGNGGGLPPFHPLCRRDRVSFPAKEPPAALAAKVHRPMEPVMRGGTTTLRHPWREDAGRLGLTELLSVGFLAVEVGEGVEAAVEGAGDDLETVVEGDGVRSWLLLKRALATTVGFAVAVAEGGRRRRRALPQAATTRAPPSPPTSEKPSPPPQQQPAAGAAHGKAIPASPAASSSPLAPAAAPTTPTPPTIAGA